MTKSDGCVRTPRSASSTRHCALPLFWDYGLVLAFCLRFTYATSARYVYAFGATVLVTALVPVLVLRTVWLHYQWVIRQFGSATGLVGWFVPFVAARIPVAALVPPAPAFHTPFLPLPTPRFCAGFHRLRCRLRCLCWFNAHLRAF
ncbi:hypothetical protein AVEN_23146-1 [Araneus ventricosus]|uniref:Uncharacterized protein n=1 Tax=Araneus ventricosus TaxID=182803 RepID=A0A4Y2RCB0_ARAVE|nr:hypothetical protein AVEN_23146-1 [Araneus ventricosus]